jgi:hypothetical protein
MTLNRVWRKRGKDTDIIGEVGGGSSIEEPFLGGWLSHHVGEVLSKGGGSTVWVGPMWGDTEGGIVRGVVVGVVGGSVASVGAPRRGRHRAGRHMEPRRRRRHGRHGGAM